MIRAPYLAPQMMSAQTTCPLRLTEDLHVLPKRGVWKCLLLKIKGQVTWGRMDPVPLATALQQQEKEPQGQGHPSEMCRLSGWTSQ